MCLHTAQHFKRRKRACYTPTHTDSSFLLNLLEEFIPLIEHNVRATTNHTQIMEIFKNSFTHNGPGAVEWQKKVMLSNINSFAYSYNVSLFEAMLGVFTKPVLIGTDASNFALKCILLQGEDKEEHPIEFASRLLNPA
ncbi:hypothetical protein TNIN_409671 [Trichonephila inaurata madagascariensis]|nr:hypothetical protein TNIN_409671 [Trichonephila inaurata madagascariensis]